MTSLPSLPIDQDVRVNDAYLCPPLSSEDREGVVGQRVLVMGSGNGSNFEALVHALRPFGIAFTGLFCNRPKAHIVERAKRLDVPVTLPSQDALGSREKINAAVESFLAQPFDLLVLAGYMRILPSHIVTPHADRILNIHPSWLPDFPGLDVIEKAWRAGVKQTGVTVHWVDEGVDTGAILAQVPVPIVPNEPLELLKTRIHEVEHRLYPWVVLHALASQNRKKK